MLFLSFLSTSSTVIAAVPEQQSSQSSSPLQPTATGSHRKFVVYYGWYSDSRGELGQEIDRIIAARPEFVISPYHTSDGLVNLSPRVIDRFHEAGVKIIAYVATGNGNKDLEYVFREIRTGLDSGADGVFLDEVSMLHSDREMDHYSRIYDCVKSFGSDKVVIANPGSVLVNEKVMNVSDIVSFEHQWRLAPYIDWFSRYPATRFMGISSNDIDNVMGYRINQELAPRDTIEAWQEGIGYHYSTNKYITLEPWFEEYQRALEDYTTSDRTMHQLQVKTVGADGNEIRGLWIEVKKSERVVITGFSPTKFLLPDGDYEVGAGNYQNFTFLRWQDGETSPYHKVRLARDAELVATYRTPC